MADETPPADAPAVEISTTPGQAMLEPFVLEDLNVKLLVPGEDPVDAPQVQLAFIGIPVNRRGSGKVTYLTAATMPLLEQLGKHFLELVEEAKRHGQGRGLVTANTAEMEQVARNAAAAQRLKRP